MAFKDDEVRREYDRNWYHKHKGEILPKKRERRMVARNRNKAYILEYFKSHPCADCGNSNPVVFDFDHISGEKKYDLSKLIQQGASITLMQCEIDKCEVRCANCHRIRHNNERVKSLCVG